MRGAYRVLPLVALLGAWSAPAFAQRQTAVGPGVTVLSPTGSLNGVDMSDSGTTGTLSVGVVGGSATDILSRNAPFVAGPIAVSTAASSQGNIVFNSSSTVFGDIGVTQPGGPFLLNISGGNAGATVNFLGAVYATTLNVSGTGTVNFLSGTPNIVAANFAADGTISLAPNTTVIGALTTTAGANTGTLLLGGGSTLNGAVGGAVGLRSISVVGGSNLAGVAASITGATDVYTLSLGTNTLNVGGALTMANVGAGGVVNTTIASSSVYGNVRVVGATNLGPRLTVNVTVPSSAALAVGTQFNIIQTQAGTLQSGTNGSVLAVTVQDPTNPLYSFSAVPLAGTIAGLVAIRTDSIPLIAPLVATPGVILPVTAPVVVPVVPVLVALIPTAAPAADILTVIAPINALTTPGAVVNAVAQLAPSTASLAAPAMTFQTTRQFQELFVARLNMVLCRQAKARGDDRLAQPNEDATACQARDQAGNWWLKGFGYVGSQGARQSFAGYNATILGTMVGYDMPLGPDTRIGLGIGYAGGAISEKSGGNRTDFSSVQATAYAGHTSGPWFIDGALSFGWNEYSGRRNIVFPGVNRSASASYSGQDYGAFLITGFNLPVMGFIMTPLASLQYSAIRLGGYSETGAGDINLRVRGQSYNYLESGLGLKVSRQYFYEGIGIVPEIHAKWLHALINPTVSQNATFAATGSGAFTTPGLRSGADTLNLGTGITLFTCSCAANNWSVEAVYDYYIRNDGYSAHQAMIKFSARF